MPAKKPKQSDGGGPNEPGNPERSPERADKRQMFRQRRFLNRHRDEAGIPRDDLWREGIKHLRRMRVDVARVGAPVPGAPAPAVAGGVRWKQVGPQPLRIDADQNFQGAGPDSGEVVDIAIDPRGAADQVIYIASNDGGIWKTTDGGTTWAPKIDLMPSLSMGAVALDPNDPDIVYAGTGNPFDGGGGGAVSGGVRIGFSKGVGIYRSTDAGETWTQLGATLLNGRHIKRIVVPRSDVLLLATESGLFRSIDGGQNFGANVPKFDDGNPVVAGDITDLDLDTKTPASVVYASIRAVGILVSTNGGITFDAASNLFNNPGAPAAGSFSRIVFAQSVKESGGRQTGDTLYAAASDPTVAPPALKGLFKSTDRGANWTAMPDAITRAVESGTAFGAGGDQQIEYNLTLGVDPLNDQRVYMAFQQLFVSTDGAANFGTPAASLNQIHYDNHTLNFSPHDQGVGAVATPVYAGTDGGISRSNDGGATWASINETIATNLFLGIDIGRGSPANNGTTFGGCQDTGTVERRPAFAGADWHLGKDGDGGPVAVDTGNPQRAYGRDNGFFIVTNDGGTNWSFPTAATTNLPAGTGGFATGTPLAVDLNTAATVYVSQGNQLFQSTNSGASFTAINTFPNTIRAFALVKLDSKVAMVGCSDGSVHRTTNLNAGAGSIWTNVTAALTTAGALGLPVGGIAIDPTDTNTAVVVFDGFSAINPVNRTKHVFRTTDGGANWNDISGTDGGTPDDNLPDLPVHSVVIDPTGAPHPIIVAIDSGVMRSTDNGATWQIFGVGLPTVDCTSLAIDAAAAPPLIRLGTYGRSVFELERPTGPVIAVRSNLAFSSIAQGANADLTVQVFNVGTTNLVINDFSDLSGSSDFQVVVPPPFPLTVAPGTEVDFTVRFTPSKGGNQRATLSISNNDGTQPVVGVPASGSSPATGPQVTGLIPSSGAAAGGTAVKILGTGFTGASTILFGASGATSFTVDNDTQVTAVSPPGAGIVDVLVTTPSGTSVASAASRFSYAGGVPAVTLLAPTEGTESGGTAVTITGTGFAGATQVLFGAFAATSHTVDSDTQVTAISPAGSGTVDVLVATPAGTSSVTPADRFKYVPPSGGVTTGTGTTTTTTTGGQGVGPPDANSDILSALAEILRTGTDPEVLEAQRILLRRIALGGDVVQSRIPAPKNITEIGGYINLLATLDQPELRLQMLASLLGVAGESATLGFTETGPLAAFVSLPNDRPEGPAQAFTPPRFTLRSDMIDPLQETLQIVHGVGCAVSFLTPPRVLPRPLPGARPPSDFLTLLGRTLDVVTGALLGDPANDPLAIARRASDPPDAFQLVAREIDGGTKVAEASWIAFTANAANVTVQPAANRRYLPLNPLFAAAGWYPIEPVVLPTSLVKPGSLARFVNITGLVRDETRLGQELALLYPTRAIMTSALVAQLSWIWNGTTFVPPR